jgi:hypothetical protein
MSKLSHNLSENLFLDLLFPDLWSSLGKMTVPAIAEATDVDPAFMPTSMLNILHTFCHLVFTVSSRICRRGN